MKPKKQLNIDHRVQHGKKNGRTPIHEIKVWFTPTIQEVPMMIDSKRSGLDGDCYVHPDI